MSAEQRQTLGEAVVLDLDGDTTQLSAPTLPLLPHNTQVRACCVTRSHIYILPLYSSSLNLST